MELISCYISAFHTIAWGIIVIDEIVFWPILPDFEPHTYYINKMICTAIMITTFPFVRNTCYNRFTFE